MTRPPEQPFAVLLDPLVAAARDQLAQARIDAGDRIAPEAWSGAEQALRRRLGDIATPVLLEAFRAEHALPIAARLSETTPDWVPRMHYDGFVAKAQAGDRMDGTEDFFDRWPVLAHRLRRIADDWRTAVVAFAGHLAADDRGLRSGHPAWRLGVPPVVGVEFGLSDPHAGCTVGRITFADGRVLAYKPRSLAVEAAFSRLLWSVCDGGEAPRQRAPWVLDRRDHGWMEWVRHEACRSVEEAEGFFERCGGLLALLDVLRGGDIHPDNLIAAGAFPVIVDLECLFQPSPADLGCADPLDDPLLFSNGVLPVFTSYDGGATMVPVAAAGVGAPTMRPGQRVRHPNSDWMHVATEPVAGFDANGPCLDGVWLDVRDFADAVVRGFHRTLTALARRRAALLGRHGAIRRFRSAAMRLLCAPTNLYALVVEAAPSAEGLRDEAAFRARLSRAGGRLPLIGRPETWRAVLQAEMEAMERLDIPAFIFQPSQRSARAVGGASIGPVFDTPMYDRVERTLLELDEHRIENRAELMRAVLRRPVAQTDPAQTDQVQTEPAIAPAPPVAPDARDTVRLLAERIAELGVRQGEDAVAWVRLWEQMPALVAPAGPGLCYGASGVAVFLAEAARLLGEDRLARLAVRALHPVRRLIRRGEAARLAATFGPGYGRGIGGVIAGLSWCGGLLEEPALIEDARTLASAAARALKAGSAVPDLMDGATGLALGLAVLHHRCLGDPVLLGALDACGRAILAASRRPAPGLRDWPDRGRPGLPGLSHGASGMAAALARIHAATREGGWRDAALEALAYEDTLFKPDEGNWERVRAGSHGRARPGAVTCTWCHGAPGIALARHATMTLLDEGEAPAGPEIRASIATALATTRRHRLDAVDDLCCGEAGRLDILSTLAAATADDRLDREVDEAIERRLPDWSRGRARFLAAGALGAPEDPSLFRGFAGLGHLLVRRLAPELAVDVLLPS